LPTLIGSLQLTYDASGNPTSRKKGDTGAIQNLVWDDDNRMVSFSGGNANQRNTYDASGNRVRRKSTQSETIFSSPYFDLENGVQGVSHMFAGGSRVASKLGKFAGGASPAAPTKAGTAFFFHADHLDSTSVLTDENGAVQESIEYFSDGEMWIDRGPLRPVSGFLFSSKPFDPDTGFYDFGQRFYDPRASLWLGVDPVVKEDAAGRFINAPLVLSVAAYAHWSPGYVQDPDGRDPPKTPEGKRLVAEMQAISILAPALDAPGFNWDTLAQTGASATEAMSTFLTAIADNYGERDIYNDISDISAGIGDGVLFLFDTSKGRSNYGIGIVDEDSGYYTAARLATVIGGIKSSLGGSSGRGQRSCTAPGEGPEPVPSGRRSWREAGISSGDAKRIQNAANRTKQTITVVGSRAQKGASNPESDWDYVMSGNSRQRHSARSSVPRGAAGGEIGSSGRESGIDIFTDGVNEKLPHCVFEPEK
jgi:RHS repeat-associated protein